MRIANRFFAGDRERCHTSPAHWRSEPTLRMAIQSAWLLRKQPSNWPGPGSALTLALSWAASLDQSAAPSVGLWEESLVEVWLEP